MTPSVRKYVVSVERISREAGQVLARPIGRAVAAAVMENPFAGRYVEDLSELYEVGERIGRDLGHRARIALAGAAADVAVESYGKAAMVGTDGELEHAAALLHPRLGVGLRDAIGGGAALIPSAKSVGGPGSSLLIPLGHKDAAYVRSHFDAIEVSINDAPRRGEIVVAIALTDGGRPLSRVGGLQADDVVGLDGLR